MSETYTCDEFQACADQADREMRDLNCANCDLYQERLEDEDNE